jgi:NAD(P)-dependent dehydrogenase (short-subunit alcohol dehydrogenase family)
VAASISKSHPDVEVLTVPTDITDPTSVKAVFEKVKEKFGHADVLVNNAGMFQAIAPVKDVDQQKWWEEMVLPSSASLEATPEANVCKRRSTSAAHSS